VVGPGREPQCAELALAFSCCVSYAGVEREPGVRLQAGLLDPLIDILTPASVILVCPETDPRPACLSGDSHVSLAFLVSPHLRLSLDPCGFTFGALVGTRSYGWPDVHSFRVEVVYQRWPFPPAKQVRFSYAAHRSGNASLSGWRQILAPASGGRLLDTYGMSAEQLAARMNSWQRRYSS
jgi:hypothetical protein